MSAWDNEVHDTQDLVNEKNNITHTRILNDNQPSHELVDINRLTKSGNREVTSLERTEVLCNLSK
ncbi:MAG: hypothetical protein IT525_01285 [Nitrosomonas sp.]|jgi:hypothetical protein|nr:hypothetical protein [Nitrosomonas sp.]